LVHKDDEKVVSWQFSFRTFFDDIFIHIATWEEHLAALRDLFDRVQKAGLTLKPSKCQFACPQVDFWVIQ